MSPSLIFLLYSLFVSLSGFTAFALANYSPKAKTALIMGGGIGIVMVLFSLFTRQSIQNREMRATAAGVGRYLILIFALVFCWRGIKLVGIPEKSYLLNLFLLLSLGSFLAFMSLTTSHRQGRKGGVGSNSVENEGVKRD